VLTRPLILGGAGMNFNRDTHLSKKPKKSSKVGGGLFFGGTPISAQNGSGYQ
jgi:hypothetical protein